jgi:hypothetical protein
MLLGFNKERQILVTESVTNGDRTGINADFKNHSPRYFNSPTF